MRKFYTSVLLIAVFVAMIVPANAQFFGGDIEILPVDRAQFLPGAFFDMRVEVRGMEELPEDFSVTINGEAAADFFGAEFATEGWDWDGTAVSSIIGRDLTITEPGEYVVEVTAGDMTAEAVYTVREPQDFGATNVILFVADGGSVGANTAARLLSRGIDRGFYNDRLFHEQFEEIGFVSTSGTDSIITDSANSASSYNTGHKSAVNATGVYADTSEDAYDDPRVETFAEMVSRTRGMSVGVVTTAYMQDATPAAVWGHSRERNSRSRCDFARALGGYEGTLQSPFFTIIPDVALGGGAQYVQAPSVDGSRCDAENYGGEDVDAFMVYEDAGYAIATTATELEEAVAGDQPIVGVFARDNIDTWLDRNVYTDNLESDDQPGLSQMVTSAIEVLSENENGFYLQVEAASVDKAFHPMDMERALADLIEMDIAIADAAALLEEMGMLEDTLIIVTADHGHSFDVFGTVDVEAFNAAEDDLGKRDAIGVYSGAGFPTYEDADGDLFPDDWDVDVTLAWGKVENPPFTENYQVSEVYRSPSIRDENGIAIDNPDDDANGLALGGNLPTGSTSSVHTLQDVPVYAQGPGSEQLGANQENIEIFFAMAGAIGLDPREDMMAE